MIQEKTREKVFNSIITYISEHGYPPSAQDICDMTHLKSKASVHEYLRQLMMEGKIESDDEGKARAIKVAGYMYIKKEEIKKITVEKFARVSESQSIRIEKNGNVMYSGRAGDLCTKGILDSIIDDIAVQGNTAILQIA